MNGKALEDLRDPKDPTRVLKRAGQQLDGFHELRDDGSTMCGNWVHSGVYTEAGNNAQRRNNADPTGLGMFHDWAFSWPANRRVMYNRAAADASGRPWDATRAGIRWNGEQVGGRRARYQGGRPSRNLRGLRHDVRGSGPALRPEPGGWAVPGALRAAGGARSRTRCIPR